MCSYKESLKLNELHFIIRKRTCCYIAQNFCLAHCIIWFYYLMQIHTQVFSCLWNQLLIHVNSLHWCAVKERNFSKNTTNEHNLLQVPSIQYLSLYYSSVEFSNLTGQNVIILWFSMRFSLWFSIAAALTIVPAYDRGFNFKLAY